MDFSIFEENIGRRKFVKSCIKGACAFGIGGILMENSDVFASLDSLNYNAGQTSSGSKSTDSRFVKEARHYTKLDNGMVQCKLCPRNCPVPNGARGLCGVRENRKGTYYTLVYSRVCALHIDPIEKKPLFHYKPSKNAFSIATPGCNISCKFCQNWQISQAKPEDISCDYISPQEIVSRAKSANAACIAYTYSEPTIFYEFMYDTAKLANESGIKSVIITNGFISAQAQDELLDQLDAVKIDLKGCSEKYYGEVCGASLKPVLESVKRVKNKGKWLELVVLILPTLNDSEQEITQMADWISGEIGDDVPVHFSRFHPEYKLRNLPMTPLSTLEKCVEICKNKGLKYVYLGNMPGHPAENTYCPSCSKMIIKRYGYYILDNKITNGTCSFCGTKIAGVFT